MVKYRWKKQNKKSKQKFKFDLNWIRRGKYTLQEQEDALEKLTWFTKHEKKLLFFSNDYFTIVSEAKHASFHGEGLQRLPIAFAQVKAGNISENVLNEIGQIIYPLYQVKWITKKV